MPRMPGFKAKVTGGARFHAFIRQAKAAQVLQVKKLTVGIHDNAEAALSGAIAEFGSEGQPERPWFRNTKPDMVRRVREVLRRAIRKPGYIVTPTVAAALGRNLSSMLKQSVESLSSPPNAAATLRKKEGSNPLVDEGRLKEAIGFKVES